jgi:mRNA-degrading endonuclease RelE of RelBE toxin-antitoxin system
VTPRKGSAGAAGEPPAGASPADAAKAPRAPARPRKPRAAAPPALPDPAGDAPIEELSRDALSVLLYVALLPDETRAIVRDLGLSVPGFRAEALSDVERCDVLADEIRAVPPVRARAVDALRKAFGRPPHVRRPYDAVAADDLLAVGQSDHGLTLALWRVLADPDPAVRARAVPVLERLAKEYYGPLPEGAERPGPAREDGAPAAGAAHAAALAKVKELEKELGHERARAESQRKKAEEQKEKLQEWLKEARARAAQAVDEAARAREAAEAGARTRERAEAALAAAQGTDAAAELQRARAHARELEGRAGAAEAKLARAEAREGELAAALREAEARAAGAERPGVAVTAGAGAGDPEEPEDAPASWLMPVYTREFYDSLDGWDRRVQRAAFKQAHLLAQDHRHPSLRALPLEGLPGYYRVRVATDVRLLYRRGDRQNTIEILSLIDREDLDRYVRQAKTRQ